MSSRILFFNLACYLVVILLGVFVFIKQEATIENGLPEDDDIVMRVNFDQPKQVESLGVAGTQVIKSDLVGIRNYEKRYSAIIDACYRGLYDMAKKLLEDESTDPNVRSFDGGTPLMYTVKNGDDTDQVRIFDLLIDHGASALRYDVGGFLPQHVVSMVQDYGRRNYYIEMLLKHGANIDDVTRVSESSAKVEGIYHGMRSYNLAEILVNNYDRLAVVDILMRWGWLMNKSVRFRSRAYAYDIGLRDIADEFDLYEKTMRDKLSRLSGMRSKQDMDVISKTLYDYGFAEGIRDPVIQGEYSTFVAHGHIVPIYRGMTPLQMAILAKKLAKIKNIVQSEPYQVEIVSQDRLKRSPLHMAIFQGDATICAFLLQAGAKTDSSDYQGNTPLHLVARLDDRAAKKKLTKLLVDAKSPLGAVNLLGETILHTALYSRDREYVRYLFDEYGKIGLPVGVRGGLHQLLPSELADRLGMSEISSLLAQRP